MQRAVTVARGAAVAIVRLFMVQAIVMCVASPFAFPILGYIYGGDVGAVLGLLCALVAQFLLVSIIYLIRQWHEKKDGVSQAVAGTSQPAH